MFKKIAISIIMALLVCPLCIAKGHLVIIGGGKRPDYMMEKIIALAGGPESKIVIIPNASSEPLETAQYQQNQFKELGVLQVDYILCDRETANEDSVLRKLSGATGIFLSGGDQSRLTRDFLGTKVLEKIRQIYQQGGVIAGTSAGAAVTSGLMITGNELINQDTTRWFHTIQKGNIELVDGFGLIEGAIIDQHFIERKRNNRLISVVLEYPELIGIGIDEKTAVVVKPDNTFEVLGESQVIVYDATKAKGVRIDEDGDLGAHNLKMHVLLNGDVYDLRKHKVRK